MPKIGAHVSAAVSLETSFKKALDIGAECTQFFISPPQQWAQTKHDEEEISRYLEEQKKTGIGPNYIHGTYLVNLGSDSVEHVQKSVDWLIYALNMASKLSVRGVIIHTGSHKGKGFDSILEQVITALKNVLSNAEGNSLLMLETSAGGGGTIGRDFRELGLILKQVNNPRLKVCLDTQHVFAGGYDLKSKIGLDDALVEFEEQVGLKNLECIHANDSKAEYRSNRDRHENIGEGFIGLEGFENLINHPKLNDVPFILEVPGFSGNGPDAENIQKLKSLMKKEAS